MSRRAIYPMLIVAAGLLAYANSFNAPFFFDDISAILENPNARQLWPLTEAMSAPQDTTLAGRPIVSLTFALNYAVSGYEVFDYHVVNLLLHVLNALLLYAILCRMLQRLHASTLPHVDAPTLSLAVALLWVAHPLQTEAVTYIVQRTELLMGFFLLLTLYCFIRGLDSEKRGAWFAASIASCALGMGCKETMVVTPVIVLLFDRAFLSPSFREIFKRHAPLYAGLATTWLILVALLAVLPRSRSAGFGLDITPLNYAMAQCRVILRYLRLSVWPDVLVADYFKWPLEPAEPLVFSVVIVAAMAVGALWLYFRRPASGFWAVSFFVLLAPTSSFLPIGSEVAAERRMYLPLAAVIGAAVFGAYFLANKLAQRFTSKETTLWMGEIVLLAAVAVALMCATFVRNKDYRTELSIWSDTAKKMPANSRAHNNLGVAQKNEGDALGKEGRFTEAASNYRSAADSYRRSIELNPNRPQAHKNLGLMLHNAGNTPAAVPHLIRALELDPDNAESQRDIVPILKRYQATYPQNDETEAPVPTP